MKVKILLLAAVSGAIVAFDQFTKILILTNFHLGESHVVIQDFFNITYVRNFGAAFGFLAQANPTFREIFFLSIPPIAMVVILRALKDVEESAKLEAWALSLIFGGAVGNYIDRLRFRYVVDFLDFHFKDVYTYPAFNIADSAIVIGIGLLLITTLFKSKEKTEEQEGA